MTQPSEKPSPPETTVDLVWPTDMGANAEAVNQALISNDQAGEDVVYLYLGHVAPPPWLTESIALENLSELGNRLPVTPKGSFILSRTRAEELWTVLGRHLGKLPK